MQAVLSNTLLHFVANWAAIREAEDPTAIHQMRVALRRMRAALAMFKPGATDGRMTQVLPLGPMPAGGRMATMANDEKFKKALERKIEPGVKVIVDVEAPKK